MGTLLIKKEFKYKYSFGFYKEFLWRTGNLSSYWYQVVGCCKNINSTNSNSCPPFKTDDATCNDDKKSFFVQTLLAYDTEDVCQQLLNNNWNWELCSVKRWSRPAENSYVDLTIDECNFLQEVPFKELPECLSLSVSQKIDMNIKCIMEADFALVPFEPPITPTPEPTPPDFTYPPTPIPTSPPLADISVSLDEISVEVPVVYINCSQCNTLSSKLYCSSNLINLGLFSNFINNNNQEFDTNFSLTYSKNTDYWSKNFYYSDSSVVWNIYFSLGCAEGTDIEYYWKFLMLFKKLENGVTLDSKLSIEVPSEYVCGYNSEFIFNFNFNVVKKYLFTNINYFGDNFIFYDKIGLFTNNYWFKNPEIYIRITENYDPNLITRKTIDY